MSVIPLNPVLLRQMVRLAAVSLALADSRPSEGSAGTDIAGSGSSAPPARSSRRPFCSIHIGTEMGEGRRAGAMRDWRDPRLGHRHFRDCPSNVSISVPIE